MTFGASVTAHIMGTDVSNLKRWVASGMPKEGRGRYHLPSCVQWKLEQSESRGEDFDHDLNTRKASLYESQEAKNRIDTAERLALLVPRDEVEQALATLTQLYVDALESIATRVDAEPRVISQITRECRAARADVARAVLDASKRLRADPPDTLSAS